MTDSPRKAGTEKKIPMNNAHRLDHILDSAQVPYIDETWEPWRLPHLTRLFGEVADAILLVNARNDLAWCLGEIERLSARIARSEPRYHARTMALIKIRGLARQAGLTEIQGLANDALTTTSNTKEN